MSDALLSHSDFFNFQLHVEEMGLTEVIETSIVDVHSLTRYTECTDLGKSVTHYFSFEILCETALVAELWTKLVARFFIGHFDGDGFVSEDGFSYVTKRMNNRTVLQIAHDFNHNRVNIRMFFSAILDNISTVENDTSGTFPKSFAVEVHDIFHASRKA